MVFVVVNGVGGFDELRIGGGGFAGVEVAVEAREVARRDFEANAVAFEEDVAGGPEVDFVFVDLAGLDEFGFAAGFAIAGAENSFGEVLRVPVGPDIDELAVKSVSTAEDPAKRSSVMGPVTSVSVSSGGVE